MAERVFVGGYASSEYQVNLAADKMSHFHGEEVEGITFVDGLRNPELLASKIHLKFLETHSGGFLPVQNALQKEPDVQPLDIRAIAAPTPTSQLMLMYGSRLIGANLVMDSVKHPESAVSNFLHGAYVLGEVARHAVQHVGVIPAIAKFNAVDEAAINNSRGIPTSLVVMNNDEFFEMGYEDILKAKRESVQITYIRGEHCDLICRPEFVLSRIAVAQALQDVAPASPLQVQQPA